MHGSSSSSCCCCHIYLTTIYCKQAQVHNAAWLPLLLLPRMRVTLYLAMTGDRGGSAAAAASAAVREGTGPANSSTNSASTRAPVR